MLPWLRKAPLGVPEIPPVTFDQPAPVDVGLGPGIRPPQVNLPTPEATVGTYGQPPQPQQDFGGFGTIKQGTVFGPSQAEPSIYNPPAPQPYEPTLEDRISKIYSQIYTPETKYADQMGQMLEQFPVREKPNMWRRLGSLPAGIAYGPQVQEAFLNKPYNQKLGDWKEKFDPTYKAAGIEKGENINERMLATQTASQAIQADRAATYAQGEQRRREKMEADVERDRKRNEINEFRAKNPNWGMKEEADGYWWMYPPRPDMGKPFNTGLRINEVSELQKHAWKMEEIQEQGTQRRQTQRDRRDDPNNPQRYWIETTYDANGNPAGTIRIDKVTGDVYPVTIPSSGQQGGQGGNQPVVTKRVPTEDITNQAYLKYLVLKLNDPILGALVNFENGSFVPARNATPAQRQQISNFIFGQNSSITNQNQSQNVPPLGAAPGGTWRTDSTGKQIYEVPSYAAPMRSNTAGTRANTPAQPAPEAEPDLPRLPDFTPEPQAGGRGRGAGAGRARDSNTVGEAPVTEDEVNNAKTALAAEGKAKPEAFEILAKIRAMRAGQGR